MSSVPDFDIQEDEMRFIIALVSFHGLIGDYTERVSYKVAAGLAWQASDAFMEESEKRMNKEEKKNAG